MPPQASPVGAWTRVEWLRGAAAQARGPEVIIGVLAAPLGFLVVSEVTPWLALIYVIAAVVVLDVLASALAVALVLTVGLVVRRENRGQFPNDLAVIQLLWLSICNIEDKRAGQREKERGRPASERKAPGRLVEGQVVTNWKQALEKLALVYPDRIKPPPPMTGPYTEKLTGSANALRLLHFPGRAARLLPPAPEPATTTTAPAGDLAHPAGGDGRWVLVTALGMAAAAPVGIAGLGVAGQTHHPRGSLTRPLIGIMRVIVVKYL